MFGFFGDAVGMEKAAAKLKILRKSAVPKLTVRAMAEALEMPLGSYARYESAYDYKKNFLPVDLTRKIATVLSRHNVDPAEVMALAGLTGVEAEPEAREIKSKSPDTRFVTLQVALPSEDALADMFQTMLVAVPADAPRAEAARILAQLLPSGFASIGPAALAPGNIGQTEAGAAPQSPATDNPGSEQPQHI